MKNNTGSILYAVIIYFFISTCSLAEEDKSVIVVNYFGNDGLLYSFRNMVKTGYSEKPTVKKIPPRNWGLTKLVETSITNKISSIEGFKIKPINIKIFNKLELEKLNQVVKKYDLPRRTLEKLSKLGREQKVDLIYAIYPAKGHFKPPSDKNTLYFATPPGLAVLYGSSAIYESVSMMHFLIDVKRRTILSSSRSNDARAVKFNKRALKEIEIAAVLKWVNEDISDESEKLKRTDVDFSKPLTDADIKIIHSKVIEKFQEDIPLLDEILNPLHHTMDEFEQLNKNDIASIRQAMHESALTSVNNVEEVLDDAFNQDEVD